MRKIIRNKYKKMFMLSLLVPVYEVAANALCLLVLKRCLPISQVISYSIIFWFLFIVVYMAIQWMRELGENKPLSGKELMKISDNLEDMISMIASELYTNACIEEGRVQITWKCIKQRWYVIHWFGKTFRIAKKDLGHVTEEERKQIPHMVPSPIQLHFAGKIKKRRFLFVERKMLCGELDFFIPSEKTVGSRFEREKLLEELRLNIENWKGEPENQDT